MTRERVLTLGIVTVIALPEAEAIDLMKLVASRRGANGLIYMGKNSEISQNTYTGQINNTTEYRGLAIFINR